LSLVGLISTCHYKWFCHVSRHIGAAGRAGSGFVILPLNGSYV
jgi:hypothetical protein